MGGPIMGSQAMRRRSSWLAVAVLLAAGLSVGSSASAQTPAAHDPARLFPREAPVDTRDARGLVRLPLTAEVLERTRPDLSDLRLHDENGRDVPFLVDSGARPWPADVSQRYEVTPLSVDRQVERGDSLIAHWRETLVVLPPGSPPDGARWVLQIDSRLPSFVRQVIVRRLDPAGGEPIEIARASVFRLQSPLRERLSVPLPSIESEEGDPQLEVELLGEGGYVEPTLAFTGSRLPLEPTIFTLPLAERGRVERDGHTVIELERPVGFAPDRMRITTTTRYFHRSVRVLDLADGRAPRELGRGSVFRASEVEGAEWLEIDVSRAEGEAIRVEIEDGDSPPLGELVVAALVRQPVLIFDAPTGPVTLRFGGGRAHAPRYDLARWAGTRLGELVLSVSLPEAELGPTRDNPRFDDGPALRFAMRAGRAPDASRYTHVAPVTIEGAREGLSRLRLPPDVLAFAREDLADVRVVDAEGRQWPYLRSPFEASDVVDATVDAPSAEGRESTYLVHPPVEPARADRLVLHTDAPYVERAYVLRAIDATGRRVELARGRIVRAPDDAGPLTITFSPTRVRTLELVVTDGSDAPLDIERAELSLPSPTLFLAAPDGDYRMLIGDDAAIAPEYEIARATDLVLSVRAADGTVGAASVNAAHVEPPWYQSSEWHTWIVWAVLILAVLVLGVLTIRLARQGSDDEGEPGGGSPPEPASPEGEEPEEPSEPKEDASGGRSSRPVSF